MQNLNRSEFANRLLLGYEMDKINSHLKLIQMKRVLSLRNNVGVALAFAGLLVVTSSFTFGPVESAQLVGDDSQQKEQKVKVVVVVDGKTTRIDTTFNLPDDTIINYKVDSMLKKLDEKGMSGDKANRMVFRLDRSRKFHHENRMEATPGDEQFDFQIQNGDSAKINTERQTTHVKRFGNNRMEESEELLPPLPPMPPHAFGMIHQRFGGDPFAFDTKDESVISYEKKDIGNGLERITIVRKKHDEPQMKKEISVKVVEGFDAGLIKKKEAERQALKKLKEKAESESAAGEKK